MTHSLPSLDPNSEATCSSEGNSFLNRTGTFWAFSVTHSFTSPQCNIIPQISWHKSFQTPRGNPAGLRSKGKKGKTQYKSLFHQTPFTPVRLFVFFHNVSTSYKPVTSHQPVCTCLVDRTRVCQQSAVFVCSNMWVLSPSQHASGLTLSIMVAGGIDDSLSSI